MVLAYDGPYSYDELFTYDGPEAEGIYGYFTCPTLNIMPPYLPTTTGPALGLFRHYANRSQGVNVFMLSDSAPDSAYDGTGIYDGTGTYDTEPTYSFVQDYATPENSNTNIPYPWDPTNLPPDPYARVYSFQGIETDFNQFPYIVMVFYGGHSPYPVTEDLYNMLYEAGYADCLVPA